MSFLKSENLRYLDVRRQVPEAPESEGSTEHQSQGAQDSVASKLAERSVRTHDLQTDALSRRTQLEGRLDPQGIRPAGSSVECATQSGVQTACLTVHESDQSP